MAVENALLAKITCVIGSREFYLVLKVSPTNIQFCDLQTVFYFVLRASNMYLDQISSFSMVKIPLKGNPRQARSFCCPVETWNDLVIRIMCQRKYNVTCVDLLWGTSN